MRSVAVFCGSNLGRTKEYEAAADALGRALGRDGVALVFGGTNKGLMKVIADAVIAEGGTTHGIITQSLVEKGQRYPALTHCEIVPTRTERKRRMAAIAEGFVSLPGGVGTIEELLEMWVDAQFEGHQKPLALFNVAGFFDPFLAFVEQMIGERFLPEAQRNMLIVDADPEGLIGRMQNFERITVSKWM